MSFFGKKDSKKEDQPTRTDGVLATGGKIDEMVMALIGSASDETGSVRSAIAKSLQDIGKKQPNLVLSSCYDFLIKNQKLNKDHRVILLNVMYQVLEMKKEEVSSSLAQSLIALGIDEMTKDKESVPDWQGAASSILVSLGMRFPYEILDELMKRFTPGSLPHYFIMKTLGDVIAANPVDTVPKLKEVIARVLPVLAGVKQEHMRWVFASGLGHFCEAILNYVANIDRATDKTFSVSSFSSDIFPAYEILFNTWVSSKETKVRVTTMQALGSMCLVLSKEQLEIQLPKIIPAFINIMKKEKELLPITQGLGMLLEAATRGGSRSLDPYLITLLPTIHPFACVIPDYGNSVAIKTYNELLRCIQTIATVFSDNVVTFLLERLGNKDPAIRVGTLAIFRHLISRMEPQLEDKKGLLVTGIKPLVNNETSLPVKKELAQTIITMASSDYLSLEGGETLMEFIIRTSAISEDDINRFAKEREKDKKKDAPAAPVMTPEELRSMCDNILYLAATTIDKMQKVLWPYLFEVLVPAQYTEALAVVCKCLAHVGQIKRDQEAPNYLIDFDRAVNLPKPQAIIARLFVMLNAPQRRGQLGLNILAVLKAIGPILHPSIYEMWDGAIPKLVSFLETNSGSDTWNPSLWEDLILRLASETIKIANDDEWTVSLGEAYAKQLELYRNDSEMKRVALKHLGLVLQKATHKEFIRSKLEVMIASADPGNELERQGCAQGIGYCGSSHLDMTLERLQGPAPKAEAPKEKGGLFGFLGGSKDKQEGGPISNTIILAYGYVASYAPVALITSRIDISVLNNLKGVMAAAKSPVTKECIIKTIDLVGKAMHPSHLQKEFILKQRDDLIKVLVAYMTPKEKAEATDNIKVLGLNACATLINLDPALPADLEKSLIERTIQFYALPEDKSTKQIMDNFNSMMGSILYSQPTTDTLCRLLKSIEPWVCSKEALQRERACGTVLYLVRKLAEHQKTKEVGSSDKTFTEVGSCVAMLIPRCTDPITGVRQAAIESIQLCLYLDFLLKLKPGKDIEMPEELGLFTDIKKRIVTEELNEQFSIIHELSRILSKIVAPAELPDLLLTSLKGLNDSQLSSTSGTCVVLNGLIKTRGEELLPSLPKLVQGLLTAMEGISNEQTMNGTLHAVRSLATHHNLPVVNQLLEASLPHSTFVVKSFHVLAKDENLNMEIINHLFEIINKSQLYEESPDPKNKKNSIFVANHTPMAATCALGEILQLEELEDTVVENYPLFLSSLLLRVGTANGMADNTASDQITTTFKQFLELLKAEGMQAMMTKNDNWSRFSKPDYHRAITDIATVVCKEHPKQMAKVFEHLLPYLKGNFIGQRVVTSTVFAEFINHCKHDRALLQQLVNCILNSLGDPTIKLQSLRGLGNIVSVGTDETNKYAPTVLDALMSSIDDQYETIALEAMNGLSKVFAVVDEARMAPIIINICLRIKPAFEKENEEIRSASFALFGSLYRFGSGSAADTFYEQIQNNLPALILHANEDSNAVKAACKGALRNLAPLYRAEELKDLLLSSQLDPSRTSFDYTEFLNDLSKLLIKYFPERMNTYVMTCVEFYRSNWNTLKANAAAFTGFLLGNLPVDKRKMSPLNPGLVSRALIELLKERAPEVRKIAAESISLLYNY